jgi:hypothetical protein
MHKVAKKQASNRAEPQPTRIHLADWLKEAYPDIYNQYEAVRDIEESVMEGDYLRSLRVKKLVELWEAFEKEQSL